MEAEAYLVGGDDHVTQAWADRAEEGEAALKRYIDTPATSLHAAATRAHVVIRKYLDTGELDGGAMEEAAIALGYALHD